MFKNVSNHIIANNRLLIDAAVNKARELNLNTLILGTEVEGEAKDIGGFFAAIAHEIGRSGNPVKPPACVLAAGETTVTVRGHGCRRAQSGNGAGVGNLDGGDDPRQRMRVSPVLRAMARMVRRQLPEASWIRSRAPAASNWD